MINPVLIPQPFAANGNKNTIKNIRETGQSPEDATWADGFPPVTMTPIEAGGLPPKGLDFNGIFHALSDNTVFQAKGGRYHFDAAFAESIGGYKKGAILMSADDTKEFISTVANNKNNPNTNMNGWALYAGAGLIVDASTTQKGIVQLNNTLTSNSASQAATANTVRQLNENKAEKSKTLSGYGIEDWKIENITTANASQANSSGQGVFSFATVTSDAPRWSNGEGIGANKMFQLGPDSWNTQVAAHGYGECVFIRSRRTAGGPYQPWKRLDGGDWAATEEQAGHIFNKPNIAKSHLPSGYARLSNGTIIQWGAVTAVNGQANWVYPIAFPNAALQVFASQDGVVGVTYTVGAGVDPSALKTQAKVTSTLTSGSDAFSCFAIGY